MYIEPSTNIKILHNVPLDNTYDHTIAFDDATSQYNYFAGLVKVNCTNYTYQRQNKGMLRVEGKADDYFDCNYMMFQNTRFGTKWFYAFINSVNYINNQTTEIEFEIDVMQTWYFDCDLGECFIERTHTLSDAIGDNIVPESLDVGEYVYNSYGDLTDTDFDLNDMYVVIAVNDVEDTDLGNVYDGTYGCATLYGFSCDSTADLQLISAFIHILTQAQKADAIIGMYMCPKFLIGTLPSDHKIPYTVSGRQKVFTIPLVTKNDTLDGYIPKNAKMYTYPYNYLHVDNGNGTNLSLRYEFASRDTGINGILLIATGTISQPVAVSLRPSNYKGVNRQTINPADTLNTEVLEINSFPLCSWSIDAYQAWVANGALPLSGNTLTNNVSSAGKFTAGVLGSASMPASFYTNVVGNVAGLLRETYLASTMADITRGNFNNGGVNVSCKKNNFYYGRCSVQRQYAKMIDDYFTMYGYAIKSVGRIQKQARPHWTYIKTVGCVIAGSIPSDDSRKIIEIYDRGITFWRNGNEVGNYELDNRPS